jgi:hypothetical protein
MSHIAEVYAKDLGVKIGKPIIADHYFPIGLDRYICTNLETNIQSQQYDYWGIVCSLLNPILTKHQIGILKIPEQITNKQKNFFIKKSLLYLGVSNHFVNIADFYDKPSVSILSNLYKQNFHLFKKAEVLTPDFSEIKPSFSSQESVKRINEIKSEEIAQAVLDQLGIEEKIKFKTIRTGSAFQNETVEIEPNFFAFSKELQGKPINLRGDLHFDLANICNWCKMCVVNLYLAEPFNLDLLKEMPHLKQIVFKYKKKHNEIDLSEFFKKLKNNKINIIIQTKDADILSDVRLKYFDYNVLFEEKDADISADIPHRCKFISKKRFVTNAEVFNSESSAKRLDKSNNFVYDETSSKELESLYLYDEE